MIVLTSAGLGIAIGGMLAVALVVFGISEYRNVRSGAILATAIVFAVALITFMIGVIV